MRAVMDQSGTDLALAPRASIRKAVGETIDHASAFAPWADSRRPGRRSPALIVLGGGGLTIPLTLTSSIAPPKVRLVPWMGWTGWHG